MPGPIAALVDQARDAMRAADDGPDGSGAKERDDPVRAADGGRAPAARRGRPTRQELYEEAKLLGIPGRSSMTKAELERALADRTKG
jgi:hypothetical protein